MHPVWVFGVHMAQWPMVKVVHYLHVARRIVYLKSQPVSG